MLPRFLFLFAVMYILSLSIRTPLPLRLSLSCPSANLLLAEPLATTGVSENRRRDGAGKHS